MTSVPLLPRFDEQEVIATVKGALSRLNYEATVSDLVVVTGLPVRLVEQSLELLGRRYGGSYRVCEAGDLLYRFPHGFRDRRGPAPSLRSRLLGIRNTAATIAASLFKRWLLLLLGGYSAVFLTLLFPPVLIIFAILLGSWVRGDRLRAYDDGGYYGYRVRAAASCRVDSWHPIPASKPGFRTGPGDERMVSVPAHVSLFTYLFGDSHAVMLGRRRQLSAVLSFIGERNGILSLEELMILTGLTHRDAEEYATQLLLSYRGEPAVTAGGTIVYEFPDLAGANSTSARRKELTGRDSTRAGGPACLPEESQKGLARTIGTLNLFNLFFGVYYAARSLEYLAGKTPLGTAGSGDNTGMSFLFDSVYSFMTASHLVHAVPAILVALGIVPAGVASLFFLLHLASRRRHAVSERAENERQLRRQIYERVLSEPGTVDPAKIVIDDALQSREMTRGEIAGVLDELAVAYDGEIEDVGDEHYVYHFRELARRLRDVDERRTRVAPGPRKCEDIT